MATERTWRCLWPKCQCVWVPGTWPDDDDKYIIVVVVYVLMMCMSFYIYNTSSHTHSCKSEYGSHHIPGSL